MNAVNNKERNMKLQNSPKYLAFLAVGSFLMAIISYSGLLFLKADLVGRLITGSAWSIVSFGWLVNFFNARIKKNN